MGRSNAQSKARRRIALRPTALGYKAVFFSFGIAAAWIASPYTNLFFLLCCTLIALAPLALLWTLQQMRGLEVELLDPGPIPADSSAPVRFVATCPAVRLALATTLQLEAKRYHVGKIAVVDKRAMFAGQLPRMPRGVHAIGRLRVETTWPLGLLRASREITGPRELVVFPKPAALPKVRRRSELLAALSGEALAAPGDLGPVGLRDFRDGDEARRVDWRASARRGDLIVRELEAEGGPGFEICLDRRCDSETLEETLSLIAALVLLARDDKEALSIKSQGLDARFGEGQQPISELLRWLATCETLPTAAAAPPTCSPSVLRLPLRRSARASSSPAVETAGAGTAR